MPGTSGRRISGSYSGFPGCLAEFVESGRFEIRLLACAEQRFPPGGILRCLVPRRLGSIGR